jgi:hypothetical protein
MSEHRRDRADDTYNGWTNYETWQATLWADEYGISEAYREHIAERPEDDADNDPDWIRERFEEILYGEDGNAPSGLIGDITSAWIGTVSWWELSRSWLD